MGYPDKLGERLEEYLSALNFGEDEAVSPLVEAMRYSLLAGGKRIRPILLLATGEAFGARAENLMPVAAAVEMIHTYSLIHDDLPAFDNDDLRRGKPTCHVKFGENTAILAGDALFAEAFRLIAEKQEAEAVTKLEIIKEIAAATGVKGMVGGQLMDVTESYFEGPASVELIHALKTGRLIMACVHCGGVLAGAQASELEKLRRFSAELGLLFQIKDDILDVVGETVVLGKKAGADARLSRRTYVSVYGLEKAGELALDSYKKALKALESVRGETGALAGIAKYIYERQQ